jgi:hypothetical protein
MFKKLEISPKELGQTPLQLKKPKPTLKKPQLF